MSSLCMSRRIGACLLLLFATFVVAADVERTGGPYVPTPQAVVDAMLELAKVGARDFVIDLGSGDGRIVLTAAQRYSARGVGVDIDPELVQQSNMEAQRRGLSQSVSFKEQDVLQASIAEATVLTLYLLPGMMQSLQTKCMRELKPGTRIVSHDFPFGDWKPDREVSIDIPEKYGTPGQWKSTLFYWVVPAQVHGAWNISVPGVAAQPLPITFAQHYQYLDGSAVVRGKRVAITEGKVEAERVRFKLLFSRGGAYDLRGTVDGDTIRGEAVQGGHRIAWSAVR
ncbi:MAG: class I SAM-dependent methyltransferase, partial [Burkholderiales bacterium]